MTTRIGPALAFYLAHYDDAEAIRNAFEKPEGLSHKEWHDARTVVGSQVDRDVAALLKGVVISGLQPTVVTCGRFSAPMSGDVRLKRYWAIGLPVGDDGSEDPLIEIGVAVHKFGGELPALTLFLDFGKKTQTARRHALKILVSAGLDAKQLLDIPAGWFGQVHLASMTLNQDASHQECAEWAAQQVTPCLTTHWSQLTMISRKT